MLIGFVAAPALRLVDTPPPKVQVDQLAIKVVYWSRLGEEWVVAHGSDPR